MRAEHHAAMPPLRGAGRTLPGAAGAFLPPRLLAAAPHVCTGLRIVRTLAGVSLLAEHRLLDNSVVRRDTENSIAKIDRLDLLPLQVVYCRLHYVLLRRILNFEFLILSQLRIQ